MTANRNVAFALFAQLLSMPAAGLASLVSALEGAGTGLAKAHRARAMHGAKRGVIDTVRLIGGSLIMILVITLVLTEVYGAINVTEDSPFYGVVSALETTGVSAMVLLVVGLLVIAASALMAYFNFGGGGGR